jgi:serine/threonine protein phosphatase PrpC
MKTFALTQKGKARIKNEDRYLIKEMDDGSLLLAVADGMGGHTAGDVAADIIIDKMASIKQPWSNEHHQLVPPVLEADCAILKQAKEGPEFEGMGTTITGAMLTKRLVFWVHVGDSRLFHLQDQRLIQITRDQNMAQFLVDEGDISTNEAWTHPMRKLLEQCVGHGGCEPDTGRFDVAKGDLLILTTDGLHGQLTNERMRGLLKRGLNIEAKAKLLVQASIEAGAKDDMTIVLAEI